MFQIENKKKTKEKTGEKKENWSIIIKTTEQLRMEKTKKKKIRKKSKIEEKNRKKRQLINNDTKNGTIENRKKKWKIQTIKKGKEK